MTDFVNLVEVLTEFSDLSFDFSQLPFELFRFEFDHGATPARELRVVLYPSVALIRFVSAFFTRKSSLLAEQLGQFE